MQRSAASDANPYRIRHHSSGQDDYGAARAVRRPPVRPPVTRRALGERQAYAMRRLDRAINRGYMTDDDNERARAQSWARAWHSCAYAQLDMLIRMNSLTKGDKKQ